MRIAISGFIIFILLFNLHDFGLAQNTSATFEDRNKAEKNTTPFNPQNLYLGEVKHIVIYFDVIDGELFLSNKGASAMYGNMPYKSRTGGPFIIIAKDIEGNELMRYYTPDLRIIRAFDGENKESSYIKDAQDMFIQIPYNPDIHQLDIGSTIKEGDIKTFDINRVIKGLF